MIPRTNETFGHGSRLFADCPSTVMFKHLIAWVHGRVVLIPSTHTIICTLSIFCASKTAAPKASSSFVVILILVEASHAAGAITHTNGLAKSPPGVRSFITETWESGRDRKST